MKTIVTIIGILLILSGGTFFLQGINVLPGSSMTGDPTVGYHRRGDDCGCTRSHGLGK